MAEHLTQGSHDADSTRTRPTPGSDLLSSEDASSLELFTKKELTDELKFRLLHHTGNKSELVKRLLEDNARRRADGTLDSLTMLLNTSNERLASMESLAATNEKLQADVDALKSQLQILMATANERPSEQVGQRHDDQVDTERIDEQRESTLDTPRHVTPADARDEILGVRRTPSETNDMARLMAMMVESQVTIAECLARAQQPLQVHSTSDTSTAIAFFDGSVRADVKAWTAETERIASLAHWTPSLTLVNAISRLKGPARDWHTSYGRKIETWDAWKEALTERFKRKMTMQEFLNYQAQRTLRENETITEYVYAKNAMLEKAPYNLATEERISLILAGITDDKWANPLAAQCCTSVIDLIDRATMLDCHRSTERDQN
ncbi:hypothetical protein HPB48_007098 [Haemaphysalis longicornis]|uniref:SAP domain-containing protein n=1 Tax=Haemaphysalis longicornis TaxID=44386 RepID=A0A9J6FPU4_HAELO|nr:hypothetical protein HPB48_007098 [Haemaphysalis longicornis]